MSKAQELFDVAFNVPRTPRSHEYKTGALAALKFRLKEIKRLHCPFPSGTPHADAWFAGVNEGHDLAQEFLTEEMRFAPRKDHP